MTRILAALWYLAIYIGIGYLGAQFLITFW
jgi:hypothetical protein